LVEVKRFIQDGINRVIGSRPLSLPRDHEDGLLGCQLFDSGRQFITPHQRHFKVGHNEVELAAGKQRKGFDAVAGPRASKEPAVGRFVITTLNAVLKP